MDTERSPYRILSMVPAEIVSTVRQWETRAGVAVYVLATWNTAAGKPILFECE